MMQRAFKSRIDEKFLRYADIGVRCFELFLRTCKNLCFRFFEYVEITVERVENCVDFSEITMVYG